MFLAALQDFPRQASIVIRTNSNPDAMIAPARDEIRKLDPQLAILGIQTIDQFRDRLLGLPNMLAMLLGGFGAIALLLATIGLYGVISVTVSQRAHEIGIRMAIGARRTEVIGMIMRQSLAIVLTGCAIGLLLAIAVTRTMTSLLFGVGAADPATISGVFTIVMVIAALATYIPARRAATADPLLTLRVE